MAQRRRRHLRRDSLVLLGSLVAHIIVFYFAGRELFHPYPLPDESLPVQVEIVPEIVPQIPPPPPPIVKPVPKPVTTPPQPQPQPQPQPKPVIPTPQKLTTKTVIKSTAPPKVVNVPVLTPATKQSVLANLPSAPIEAPPGPPKAFTKSTIVSAQPQHLVPAAPLNLHKPKESSVAGLAPPASIPGGFTAPPQPGGQAAGGGGSGAPGGPNAGPLRGGGLPPGFGEGLRGSLLGCINSAVAHLTPEQQARCAERLGTGVNEAPQMSAVGATKRTEFDAETAKQQAVDRYLNSTPPSSAQPNAEDPRLRDTIKGGQ